MGDDKIRHVLIKCDAKGEETYYWNPSATLRALGLTPEPLGKSWNRAKNRALALNTLADAARIGNRAANNGPEPGTVSCLFRAFHESEEYAELKPRTQKDYAYYLGKIEIKFGHLPVTALTARVIKEYYRTVRADRGVTWAYHILGTLRAVLSWAVSESWILHNPALDVKLKSPPKRTTTWTIEQAEAYIAKARELGWHSIAVMARIFDCAAQSPIDVRTLRRSAYAGRALVYARSKTGTIVSPVPLWPDVVADLDAYLATRPALLPDAPIFVNDRTGKAWVEGTLHKHHAEIRAAAGLPKKLQLQDFRRTAQTEAGAVSGTVDEIRALAQHTTRTAAEHYVMPDERFAAAIQQKRLAARKKGGKED
jgi:hypothetical protein